jgi:hypothetical protein
VGGDGVRSEGSTHRVRPGQPRRVPGDTGHARRSHREGARREPAGVPVRAGAVGQAHGRWSARVPLRVRQPLHVDDDGLLPDSRHRRRRRLRRVHQVQGPRDGLRALGPLDRAHRGWQGALPGVGQSLAGARWYVEPAAAGLAGGLAAAGHARSAGACSRHRGARWLDLPHRAGWHGLDDGRLRAAQLGRSGRQPRRGTVHLRLRHGVRHRQPVVPTDARQPRDVRRRVRLARGLGSMA